jgi:hypothetical protein
MTKRWADLDPEERERRERQSRAAKARVREVQQKVGKLKKSHPEKIPGTPEYEARIARDLAEAQEPQDARKSGHYTCRACLREVSLNKQGRTKTHTPPSRTSKCPGSGEFPAAKVAARPPICAVCQQVKRVRLTDGRIAAHQNQGQRCEGSGRTPVGGRDPIFMKGTGASGVFGGGLPESGRRA